MRRRPRRRDAIAALITALAMAAASAHTLSAERCRLPDQGGRELRDCRVGDDGQLHLSKAQLQTLPYGSDGLTLIVAGNGFYYLDRNARQLRVLPWDNGADRFEAGLVRGLIDGKVAYFDHRLRQAVPGWYDFAWPFEGDTALVCQGCLPGQRDADGHTPMLGGHWYRIDRRGRQVGAVHRGIH